ncbi:MAG: AAA family ATPase, partial [Myxococcota bacterium]
MNTELATSENGPETERDRQLVQELHEKRTAIQEQIGRRIVGQREVIDHLLITLFARGHGLFVGVPGLAKTTLIQTLADVLDLSF